MRELNFWLLIATVGIASLFIKNPAKRPGFFLASFVGIVFVLAILTLTVWKN